jgi:transposase
MSTEQIYETKRIDHLGIVGGICHEINLIEQIDQAVETRKRKVSCGEAVTAMVLNALGFSSRAMYLMPQYLHNKPVDLLIAPNLVADDFNDDTLGRSLDRLYEAGVTEVFAKVAAHALSVYEIEHRFYHLDSSSFHLHGEYSAQEPGSQAIEITYGYSKEHRPDLKQVVLTLITGHHSQLPVWMEALSGNSNDKESFPKTVQAFCEQMKTKQGIYFVVDSAMYSAKNLQTLGEIGWLTRVPETLSDAKRVLSETSADMMTELEDGYAYFELASNYGGVPQRWLVLHSPKAAQREEKTLMRRVEKELAATQKAWRKLRAQTFNCEEDALAALASLQKGWKYHHAEATPTPITRYPSPGRPAAGTTPDVVGYQLQGEVAVSNDALEIAQQSLGRFLLATNELDKDNLSSEAMLSQYKAQGISVERGFRFLKDPIFFADSLFLKNPERIMAMIMIMVLALLVYALAEHKLRRRLDEEGQHVPDQVGKDTKTPTMRWIFQLFEGIDLLIIHQNGKFINRQVLNLRPEHLTVLHLLGPPVENCYLLNS